MDADSNNMYVLQYLKYLSLFIFRFISKLNLKRRNKNNTGNHIFVNMFFTAMIV